jgi:ribosomal protein S18 acetylase RimI-like enzyme
MEPQNLSFRPIKTKDQSFLATLYAETREDEMAQSGWPQKQIDEFLEFQFQAQHRFYMEQFPDAAFDLILLKKKPIGRLYLDRRDDELRIIDIAILKAHQRKGLGGYLLRNVLDEAAKAGKPVRIHVEHNNPAMKLYKRLGFVKTGDNGVYFLMEWNQSNG